MMTLRVVIEYVAAEPFRPFRIYTVSGCTFEVPPPEFVKIGRTTVTVHTPPETDPDGPLHWEEISLVLIESIAPLDTLVASSGS